MPQFFYTVINRENRELAGTINAPDETSARKELNALGFSILNLNMQGADTRPAPETLENIIKYDFSAIDKNGKKIVGTIQGDQIFPVYKRLVYEYQFDVQSLFPSNLSPEEKEKATSKGIDNLKDLLNEENMAVDMAKKKQEMDQREFEGKQLKLKAQIDFVLQKVNNLLDIYKDELDPTRKAKIKYFVEKILRIKNSTNLDYVRQTCEEMLTYLQKEEIFLNQEQRAKEKTQLSIDAKSMMIQLNRINHPEGKDIFDAMREWRQNTFLDNPNPTFIEKTINLLISPLIGSISEDQEITAAREKVKNTNAQLKEFFNLYLHAPDPEFKKETLNALKRLWQERKTNKFNLHALIHRKQEERLTNIEHTPSEKLEKEIFSLTGWVLTFYIIYYFGTIYLNSKQIDFIPQTKLNLLFQTSIIKYFFTSLFLFVCLLGIKIEFFHRKPVAALPLLAAFLFSSTIIILNF